MATWSNFNLQNGLSPLMEQLIFFHDQTLLILLMITILVAYILTSLFFNLYTNRFVLEGQTIEIVWTILPAITLIFITHSSLRLLYLLDESMDPLITMKTIGHQWYWSYEYMDFKNIMEFDSYMSTSNKLNSFRLLHVDNRTILPMNTQILTLVTAADIIHSFIHSWTISTLGVKTDATPGD